MKISYRGTPVFRGLTVEEAAHIIQVTPAKLRDSVREKGWCACWGFEVVVEEADLVYFDTDSTVVGGW